MIYYYKNVDSERLQRIEKPQKNCWIHLEVPEEIETSKIATLSNIDISVFKDAQDENESAHIEHTSIYDMAIIDVPVKSGVEISTTPLTVIITNDYFITMGSSMELIKDFFDSKIRVDLTKKLRLMLQIFYRTFIKFLTYLREIEKDSSKIQQNLTKSMQNEELLELLNLQKSLVYFSASLSANKSVVQKTATFFQGKFSIEERNILEDVMIENKQALEMCSVYREIIKNTMDAFSYIINNNQNFVMKFLTAITILLSVPMVFSGWWGMNTDVPFSNRMYGFWFAVGLSIVASVVIWVVMKFKKML